MKTVKLELEMHFQKKSNIETGGMGAITTKTEKIGESPSGPIYYVQDCRSRVSLSASCGGKKVLESRRRRKLEFSLEGRL